MSNTSILSLNISKELKRLRLESGLSQEKLSYKTKVDRKYLHILEKGQTNISTEILNKLCLGLNISMSEFFNNINF
tara:strand:- start:506 stop:733 length:228 start_codon:yes stop_codon:yes gene_type:complete